MSLRVAFRTLGCRLNQYETEAVASELRAAGHRIVPFEEEADYYVINTCTVTGSADRKSRNLMYRALRTAREGDGDRPAARDREGGRVRPTVVVTGCYAQLHAEGLRAQERGGEDSLLVVDNEAKADLPSLLAAHSRGERPAPRRDRFGFRPADTVFRTRAFVKIQDGCDEFCTYCIVPYVRGRAISRPVEEVLAEVRHHLSRGALEIVLTGVNLGRYRAGNVDFPQLVSRVLAELPTAARDAGRRLRISSLEPDGLDHRFSALFEDPRLLPHVHLCLQSGSDRVLQRMGRRYRVEDFRRIAGDLRAVDPAFNITTDIIVGFPGETEEDFHASVAVARELELGHIHTFPYSPREGTPAAGFSGTVDRRVTADRSRILRDLAEELTRRTYERLVGMTDEVLVEKIEAASRPAPTEAAPEEPAGQAAAARGYGRYYAPVIIPNGSLEANRVYRAHLRDVVETQGGTAVVGEPTQ